MSNSLTIIFVHFFQATFAENPQYQTTLSSGAEADGRCTVIVAVMQKYRRELSAKGMDMLAIGIDVFAVVCFVCLNPFILLSVFKGRSRND